MTVNGRGLRKMFGRLPHHPHRPTRETFAEHHARGARLDHRVNALEDFVRSAGDVGCEDETFAAPLVLGAPDRIHGAPDAFPHRRIIEARI